jgi:HSP20 family molecular chaperone IbpA
MAGLLNLTPISDLTSLRESLLGAAGGTAGEIKTLAVELVQTATCTELRLAVPGGFSEKDFGFNVIGNKLVVFAPREWTERGDKSTHTGEMGTTKTTGKSHKMSKEAPMGGYYKGGVWYREFEFPMPVDVSQLGISFEHGYLNICLPVSLGIKPENISVYDYIGKKESFAGEEMKAKPAGYREGHR